MESVVEWLQQAKKLLQQLLELNLSPEERVKRTESLRSAIQQKVDHLENIQQGAEELLQMQTNDTGLE